MLSENEKQLIVSFHSLKKGICKSYKTHETYYTIIILKCQHKAKILQKLFTIVVKYDITML